MNTNPEQFKEEYGVEYTDDGAVYYEEEGDTSYWWDTINYGEIKGTDLLIVCACTPFGCPSKEWRPE